jgi:hypothetical protein
LWYFHATRDGKSNMARGNPWKSTINGSFHGKSRDCPLPCLNLRGYLHQPSAPAAIAASPGLGKSRRSRWCVSTGAVFRFRAEVVKVGPAMSPKRMLAERIATHWDLTIPKACLHRKLGWFFRGDTGFNQDFSWI